MSGTAKKRRRRRFIRKIKRNLSRFLLSVLLLIVLGIWADRYYSTETSVDFKAPMDSRVSVDSTKPLSESSMEVHFLDVGQSDCTLIICDGHAMLIDCGDGNQGTKIQYYLKKQGVEKLDYLVLTHPDADHIGGAPVIITKFEIDNIFMSPYMKDSSAYEKVTDALEYRSFTWSAPEPGSRFLLGNTAILMLGPDKLYPDSNNSSLVLKLEHGENTFLFTGDAEECAETQLVKRYEKNAGQKESLSLQADVLKVGHHGSKTSSCEIFLDAVGPGFAVISCGEFNSYGFPHARTLNSLRALGIETFRTDEQGTVIVTSDGRALTWNCSPSVTWQAGE